MDGSHVSLQVALSTVALRVYDLPGLARLLGLLPILQRNELPWIEPEENPERDGAVVDNTLSSLPDVAGLHHEVEVILLGEDPGTGLSYEIYQF